MPPSIRVAVRFAEPRAIRAVLVALMTGLLAACATLPPLEPRAPSAALSDTADTRLARALAADIAAHPRKTGVHAVPEPHDAFAARVALAGAAERSLDAQYYIWHGDEVGYLLFEALWQAAERGVRVRLLLDDVNTKGLDPTLAALDAHPNIEVRLYNPLAQRSARLLNFLTDFTRVNRRMHNKSFTVDNQVTIVGGRNIGNEYFAAGTGVAFADLDVIAAGDAVREVSKEFDIYWNSPSAYPAAGFVVPSSDGADALVAMFQTTRASPEAMVYSDAVRASPLLRDLMARTLSLEWTDVHVIYDDPAKTLDSEERPETLLFTQLVRTIGRPERSLDLVSPYFVPGEAGTSAIAALAQSGVKVRILTNSLSSAEAGAVHAGYAKRRVDLLRAGVQLYELKAVPGAPRGTEKELGPSVGSALHAKTYAVDGARVFVGSFNFDQRSAHLNTEMGFVIDSPSLAQRLALVFDKLAPTRAYEVRLGQDDGGLEWIERTESGQTVHTVEPATSWLRRFGAGFMAIMPIESLL